MVWELEWLDDNGGTEKIEAELAEGRDISVHGHTKNHFARFFKSYSFDWSAHKYEYLLKALPRYPKHDIETLESYQLDDQKQALSEQATRRIAAGENLLS